LATARLDTVFQHLRRVVMLRDGAGMTDGQLLEAFISQRNEVAFEALVRRHGPMVLKVCRRALRNHHDAEDAFQATFLVLARKASSVRPRDMVANWLYGVAYRTALKARTLRAKAQTRERHVRELPEPAHAHQGRCHDLREVLDQELTHLRDIYRLPIILCDLEGKSIKKTAEQLGWPQGTVAGRLARGRKMLAKRLPRHGLAVGGGVVVLQNSASAYVLPALVAATVKATGAYAARQSVATGVISGNVAVLMDGVIQSMFVAKLKVATVVLLVTGVLVTGGSLIKQQIAERQEGKHGTLTTADKKNDEMNPKPRGSDSGIVLKRNDKSSGKVATVITVGCDPLADALIRQEILRIYPGQDIDYNALRKADKRLSELAGFNATITILGTAQQGFKDILVTVKEKALLPQSDMEKLQGAWKVVSMAAEGKQDFPKDMTWTFSDENIEMTSALFGFVVQEATYQICNNADKRAPNGIDLTVQLTADNIERHINSGKMTCRGIFALEKDKLKICCRLPNSKNDRPTEIQEIPGKETDSWVIVLERVEIPAAKPYPAVLPDDFSARDATPAPTKEVAKITEGEANAAVDSLYEKLGAGYLDLEKANYEILVREVKGRRLIRPILVRRGSQGRNDLFVTAEEAELKVDLTKGILLFIMSKVVMTSTDGDRGYFESRSLSIPLASIEGAQSVRPLGR
jgi:RNA polymerase sigma factor (sigma-70 family)